MNLSQLLCKFIYASVYAYACIYVLTITKSLCLCRIWHKVRACNSKPGTRTMSLLSVFIHYFFLNRLKFNKAKLIIKAKDFFSVLVSFHN